MELTIFAKKRQTREGKSFFTYLTTLRKIDGTDETVSVKFREDCGSPKPENCPVNIQIDRTGANLSVQHRTDDDGNVYEVKTLWVSLWVLSDVPYVDHSLDDYI